MSTYEPKTFQQFRIFEAMHAPLIKRYKPGYGHCLIGEASTYGRTDPETGGFYTVVANEEYNEKRKKRVIMTSTDYECGAFYPATVFITGVPDNESLSLPFEDLEAFHVQFRNTGVKRVIVPQGWDPKRGGWTWRNGLQYYPDLKPYMSDIPRIAADRFPHAHYRYDQYCQVHCITFDPEGAEAS